MGATMDRGVNTDFDVTVDTGVTVDTSVTVDKRVTVNDRGVTADYGTVADCRNRRLTYIPELPSDTTMVMFNMNHIGNITTRTFQNLRKIALRQFYIQDNYIGNVSPDAFIGLDNLTVLDISKNVNINKSALSIAFNSLRTKHNLTLILNELNIKDIPEDFFDGLVNIYLRQLRLNQNLLTTFNESAFEKLEHLENLHLINNTINSITGYAVHGLRNLKILLLNDNVFARYPPNLCRGNHSTYPNLKNLNLGENLITIISQKHWYCLPRLTHLSLYGNVIQTIRDNVFASLKSLEILNLSLMKGSLKVVTRNALNNTSLLQLHLNNNGMNFVAKDTLDKNNIFKACPNLQRLYLSNNNLYRLSDADVTRLLSPLVNLRYLRAFHIRLRSIPDGFLQNFPRLQALYLDGNNIYTWNKSTFENVTELRSLSFQGNNIHILKAEQFPENLQQSLQHLNLANNPFSCTCDNLWFRDWMNETLSTGKITFPAWPSGYTCAIPPAWNRKLFKDYHPTEAGCRYHDPMIAVCVTIGSLIVMFTVVSFFVYRQRWYIRYWIYKLKRSWRYNPKENNQRHRDPVTQPLLTNEASGEEHIYDAYVIYNDENRHFVHRDLRILVEEKHNKKLCIRHRDSPLGAAMDSLIDSIYASRNAIAVISENFVNDPWCQFQLHVTLDRQVDLGRTCLLLVILENINMKALNKTWCVILTKTPTAEWCPDMNDIRHTVFLQKLLKSFAED